MNVKHLSDAGMICLLLFSIVLNSSMNVKHLSDAGMICLLLFSIVLNSSKTLLVFILLFIIWTSCIISQWYDPFENICYYELKYLQNSTY